MVRDLEQAGVRMLVESFMKGLSHMEIIGVMWLDYPEMMARFKNLLDIMFDLTSKTPPREINIIDGNHRIHGLQICNGSFPKKPLYQKIGIILLIIPRTRYNIQMCVYIGNSNNNVAAKYVKTTQWQVVCQFHRQLQALECDLTLTPAERVKAFSEYKARTAHTVPFKDNTLHTFSACAGVDIRVWRLMEKIFAGEYKANKDIKQNTPDAMTHFVDMTGIPVRDLCEWLQRVIDGTWNTSHFMKRCKIYRKAARVTKQVVEHIVILRPKYQFTDMDTVAKVYPKVVDGEWFDTVVKSCEDTVKSKLSQHAIKLIEDMVDQTERLMQETQVCCRFVDFFCVILFLGVLSSRFLICRIPSP
jgi:hypothetical protein